MFFFHSKDIKKSDFLLSPFDQKAVRIKEEQDRKQGYDNTPQGQYHPHIVPAVYVIKFRVVCQGQKYIKHHYRANAGQYIRHIGLRIFSDILHSQFYIKQSAHSLSPPVAITVSVSAMF